MVTTSSLIDILLQLVAEQEKIGDAFWIPNGSENGLIELQVTMGHEVYRWTFQGIIRALLARRWEKIVNNRFGAVE
jgi:hypothetical protein